MADMRWWTRWLVRAPVWLYRARLGILLGPPFVMLERTGRKSGARRYVVLEVVQRGAAGSHVVVSGFGDRAQWFRNIRAEPTPATPSPDDRGAGQGCGGSGRSRGSQGVAAGQDRRYSARGGT
jgi:hypothetical protein